MLEKIWHVYIVECSDGTLYTGITKDVPARISKHNTGKGAKYTAERTPVVLKAFSCLPGVLNTQSFALKIERAIKKLPRASKIRAVTSCGEVLKTNLSPTPENLNYVEWLVKLAPGSLQTTYNYYHFNTESQEKIC